MQVAIASSLAQDVAQTTQQRTQEKAEISVHKKSLDIQKESTLALLESVPASTPSSTGTDNVGKNINVSV